MNRRRSDAERKISKGKMAVSLLAAVFIFILYGVIFFFSDQDGETSGSLSHHVTEEIIEQVSHIAGNRWTAELKNSLVEFWENPVRKLAHFSEYALMGLLVYLMFRPWREREKKLCLLAILWVFVSASADEAHQLLVSGRAGRVLDVLLDTSGGGFGALVCFLADGIFQKSKKKRGR